MTSPDIKDSIRFKSRREAKDCHRERLDQISSATVAAIGNGAAFSKGRGLRRLARTGAKADRRETVPSSARYPGAAIAICALCSCRQPGVVLVRVGPKHWDRYGLKSWIEAAKNVCTTMCWRSRSPTSLPASPGRFSTRSANSSASGQTRCRPELLECRAVLEDRSRRGLATLEQEAKQTRRPSLDGPLRVARQHIAQAGTKERASGTNKGTA